MNQYLSRLKLSMICLVLPVLGCVNADVEMQDFSLKSVAMLSPEAACAQFEGIKIPAEAIELPTKGASIISSELVMAGENGNINGEYCKVLGAIHPVLYTAPDILFEVNLPTSWNQKMLQFGGGALNGVLITGLGSHIKQPATDVTALARGYVTLGSDSGHQTDGGFDGNFYLNEEALENFGSLQIKKTHDVAMALTESRYNQLPKHSYFIGGSQGGHEAFDAVQRYPQDYDGVVAGYPAHNVIMLHLSALNYARALHANEGRSWLSPGHVKFFTGKVYQVCDDLDGLEDGIISHVTACQEATSKFKLLSAENPIRCDQGAADDAELCLSDAQLSALNVMDSAYYSGFPIFNDDVGSSVFPKWTPFEGSTFFDGNFPNLGGENPGQALQLTAGKSTTELAIAQDLTMNAVEDFDALAWAGRITELTPVMSANSVNLNPFKRAGGKLIMFHGLVDDFITPYSSIQYYQRLLNEMGKEEVSEFFRFYTIPGMGHVTGPFNARLPSLDVLELWVEEGQAPGNLLASDANDNTAGRTRPVCHYPQWPRYRGHGSSEQASSFECVD